MSAKKAPVESQVAVIPAIDSDPDVYTNEWPLTSQQGIRAVFGGSLISQVISAASATVSASFKLASSQSSFMLPVKSDEKVIYRVERIANGRTFATRLVRVFQGKDDRCRHIAIIAFQNFNAPIGNVLNYATPMPNIGGLHPDNITAQKVRQMMTSLVSKAVPLLQMDSEQDPFDWRPLEIKMADEPSQFCQRGFVRSKETLSTDSHSVNLAALGYLSDEYLFGPPLLANAKKVGKDIRNVTLGVALDHHISFHDPTARADDWMVCERNTSWGADGRVLIHQRFWGLKTGQLVMSSTQEALIRLKDAAKL